MAQPDSKSLRSRLEAVGISQNVFAAFARVHDADVSRVVRGLHVASGPVGRITHAIAALEDLVGADSDVRIAMDTVENIRAAQKRLDAKRQSPIAVVPWRFRGAVAKFAPGQPLAAARAELSKRETEETQKLQVRAVK